LLAVLALCVAPLAARADDENPYKNVKEGDFATYKMKIKVGPLEIDGTTTQTIVAKTDKEATVKITASVNGMEAPAQEQKIDLTKPYDPTKVGGGLPAGADASVEKGKEGKEKVKLGGKEYDATWTTYKVKAKANGIEIEGEAKTWTAKDVPMGLIKMESTMTVMKMEMKMSMEMTESGNKKKN
jgi:hypothetical protein